MVHIGAYLAEPPAYPETESVLPRGQKECIDFLAEECRRARENSRVKVCLNLATPRLEWGLNATECFYKAGGDIVELNIHGGYQPYLRLGKIKAMVLPENRPELFTWLEAFSQMEIPVIVKFKESILTDYGPILDNVARLNLFGVHFNIRNEQTKGPDLEFVTAVKEKYSFFLLVSGYVRSSEMVRKLLEAGADMVGFAEPTIKDSGFISRVAGQKI
jgi:tRNA-dihydrouridine synthase